MPLAEIDGFSLQAVARYELTARVLRTKHYPAGPGSSLVPFDVAIAWGPMSDQSVLDQLKISQCNRFFFYQWKDRPPIPPEEIVSHSANMHVISANGKVASFVRWLRPGELVKMRGYLVNVTGPRGFHWNTSMTRTDSGKGACELYYVESAEPMTLEAKAVGAAPVTAEPVRTALR